MNADTTANWLQVPYENTTLHLIHYRGRPWLAITPLCVSLGIDPVRQARRMQRYHAAIQLPVATARSKTGEVWSLLPLEHIAWFLLTLRPKNETKASVLARWHENLPWHCIEANLKALGRYGGLVDLTQSIRHSASQAIRPPRRYKRGITTSLVEQMREMRTRGMSLRQIADELGYSAPTISQCLNGLYPSIQPDAGSNRPQTVTAKHVKGVSSASRQ